MVGAEFVLVGKETRIVGRNLIDVEPGAVDVARAKKSNFLLIGSLCLSDFCASEGMAMKRGKREGKGTYQKAVRCLIAADSVPSSR
jgi:hypothetical protein